ncbi:MULTISPECIES: hypothetical protein [Kitasatospora]|uniref:hypothetical protein n=1 Tax=Kitasatospora TaxID=2063 RepID=UPI000686743D|nr:MULTISPECIES: hypothetical protein [Kitasatospora]
MSLLPWLSGVATNVIRDTRRAARCHQRALAALSPREAVPGIAVELVGRMAAAGQIAAAKAAKVRPIRGRSGLEPGM